jgi:hypothetical protein
MSHNCLASQDRLEIILFSLLEEPHQWNEIGGLEPRRMAKSKEYTTDYGKPCVLRVGFMILADYQIRLEAIGLEFL